MMVDRGLGYEKLPLGLVTYFYFTLDYNLLSLLLSILKDEFHSTFKNFLSFEHNTLGTVHF